MIFLYKCELPEIKYINLPMAIENMIQNNFKTF